MAKKQTRRTISISKTAYQRALEYADAQGISLSQLATRGLAALGIDVGEQQPMVRAHALKAVSHRNRMQRIMARRNSPGTIRSALGDDIADALGEP